jgi:cyanophycin synthetase
MADYTQAEHLCYVTMNPSHALVREHIRAGGRAVVLEHGMNGDMITLYDNGTHYQLLWTHLIPATLEGKAAHNVQNAMFAAALAHGLGKSLDDIRHGLRTFDTTFFQAPGRMNVFDEHPFRVILDYAHNAAAVSVVVRVTDQLEVRGRRIGVIAAPGDRRDEDIIAVADAAAGHFDHYVLKADDNRRGRGPDEVPMMLRQRLVEQGVPESAIDVVPEEAKAVEYALGLAREGDLVVVFGDEIVRCWKQIIHFQGEGAEAPAEKPARAPSRSIVDESEGFVLDPSARLVVDERGVRLAREDEDSD